MYTPQLYQAEKQLVPQEGKPKPQVEEYTGGANHSKQELPLQTCPFCLGNPSSIGSRCPVCQGQGHLLSGASFGKFVDSIIESKLRPFKEVQQERSCKLGCANQSLGALQPSFTSSVEPIRKSLNTLKTSCKNRESMPSRLSTKSSTSQAQHTRIECDSCGVLPIMGTRYRCRDCVDFDLCQKCHQKKQHNHDHAFQPILYPKRQLQKDRLRTAADSASSGSCLRVEKILHGIGSFFL